MAVPLPKICSVLAHELRSPLSVLQGYIRLLLQQRDPSHPEAPMLQAMLDATGRLTAIARQASDLGMWLAKRDSSPLELVSTADVLDEVDIRIPSDGAITVIRPPEMLYAHLRADASALAGAIVALAESMARETGGSAIEIAPVARGTGAPALSLRSRTFEEKVNGHAGPASATRALSLELGGAGLALVAASYVLDAHGAAIEPGDVPGSITIRFGESGGAL